MVETGKHRVNCALQCPVERFREEEDYNQRSEVFESIGSDTKYCRRIQRCHRRLATTEEGSQRACNSKGRDRDGSQRHKRSRDGSRRQGKVLRGQTESRGWVARKSVVTASGAEEIWRCSDCCR